MYSVIFAWILQEGRINNSLSECTYEIYETQNSRTEIEFPIAAPDPVFESSSFSSSPRVRSIGNTEDIGSVRVRTEGIGTGNIPWIGIFGGTEIAGMVREVRYTVERLR